MAKRHFPVEFDVEIFRSVFNERVDMAMIKKGVRYANMYKNKDEFDSETAKSIAKEILLQKEDEFKKITNVDWSKKDKSYKSFVLIRFNNEPPNFLPK